MTRWILAVVLVVTGCSSGVTSGSGTSDVSGADGGAGSPGAGTDDPGSPSGGGGGGGGAAGGGGNDGGAAGNGVGAACPCAPGSYCELTTQTCKAGCVSAGGCATGSYCDVPNRACLPGCEGDTDCGPKKICNNHACVTDCRTCPDDGNPCTKESCQGGACVSTPMADGDACGTYKACVKGACKGEEAYCATSGTSSPWTYNDPVNPANSGGVTTCACSAGKDAILTDGTVRKSCGLCKSSVGSVQCF